MQQVKSEDISLVKKLVSELNKRGIKSFTRNDKMIYGTPNIVFKARRIAIFCDSEFWQGYDWKNSKYEIKSNQIFCIDKIESTIKSDDEVTEALEKEGWTVIRFSEKQIMKSINLCVDKIEGCLHTPIPENLRAIDLCAGIGGIRKGFELTGKFETVLSSEIDKHACATYEHLFGANPFSDLTTEKFKSEVALTDYDVLLAGFPCQTFSRVGLGEGFENEEKGKIFFHIASIIKETRPCAFFLENVDHLVTREKGKTFKTILERLVLGLNYHVIGVEVSEKNELKYNSKDFIRNSKNFGVPQNRPRAYIIGFDKERFLPNKILTLPSKLPEKRETLIYQNLCDLLETNVSDKYYMASGYLETLVRHRERQENKGYGFGYRVVNETGIQNPIANSLLATGGSGKERNLIYDPKEGVAGKQISGKRTPLNDQGIRFMTPTEWGRLQGFINYAFLDSAGQEHFSFPEKMPDMQKYKQFGNSVTIPVIEEMAKFVLKCFELLK